MSDGRAGPFDEGGLGSRRPGDRRGQRGIEQRGFDPGGYDPGGYDQGGYDQGGYDQGGYDQGGYDRGLVPNDAAGYPAELPDAYQTADAAGANTAASLQAGHPFSLLLAEDERQRATELEALLDTIADGQTRVVVATNPLRARLTLERLLIQVVSGPLPDENDPVAVIRRIATRLADENRVILVIDRAETLHPEVLHFFGQTAPYFPDAIPRLQVLFVGRPEFRDVLDQPDALMDEHTAQLEAYRPSEPDPVFAPPPEPAYDPLPPSRLPFVDTSLRAQFRLVWGESVWNRIGIIGGTAVGLAAVTVAVMLALGGNDAPITADNSSALLDLAPEPMSIEADPPVLQPGPPRDAETAQRRGEFETYLTALGRDLANSTQAQKRAWYQEFQIWRARTGSAGG